MSVERTSGTRAPGRPRSERAERAILAATLDLLAEAAGVAAVSIEAVAARAGVGKTTIYRRWPNKEELIVSALAAAKGPLPDLPPGESARENLLALARALSAEQGTKHIRCFWNVAGGAEKHPELFARYRQVVIEPRREVFRGVLRRGIESGELRPGIDVEMTISVIVGSMTMQARASAARDVAPEDFAEGVVDLLLQGISAEGDGAASRR
ncbi:TetR family transcriptional regulator [Actinomadura craniellae]|uniref:TetR family transcriptional regulator n=1 Tax=Actinomadura craniellae TaxID=2231787 RepID=A0A365H2G7_9ACTN|nr:TetR/AcrR family transcriptional regulator [Actinomadura craniellae]RAY13182.1 TetR family transcriptional regulator [Actinomadura craniellae]